MNFVPVLLLMALLLTSMVRAENFSNENETVAAAQAGRKCGVDSLKQMTCEFKIGKSLQFSIVDIGNTFSGVTFFKSDWDGDYYASVGGLHSCVIVKPGSQNPRSVLNHLAFISLKNGKVYEKWERCKENALD